MPDSEFLTYPHTRIQHEDVVTREYWDGDAQEYVNTQESMLAIKMWLETTTAEQKRIAYDSLTLLGDIGGFYDFIVVVVTPFVALIVGDRLSYHLLNKLFMVSKAKKTSDSDDDDNNKLSSSSDPLEKKERWKSWIASSEPYKTDSKTQFFNNRLISLVTCRRFRSKPKTEDQQLLIAGEKRVKRDLDIRNLIKA